MLPLTTLELPSSDADLASLDRPIWRIYAYKFANQCVYVGHTKQTINARHHSRKADENRLLQQLLDNGTPYELIELDVCFTKDDAKFYEDWHINNFFHTDILLNKFYTNNKPIPQQDILLEERAASLYNYMKLGLRGKRKAKRKVAIRKGKYACSICRIVKPHTQYQKDCSRYNGLNSRCKLCLRRVKMLVAWYKECGTAEQQIDPIKFARLELRQPYWHKPTKQLTTAEFALRFHRFNKWKIRKKGICENCYKNKRAEGITLCAECSVKKSIYKKESTKSYKDSGICIECYKADAYKIDGRVFTKCKPCLDRGSSKETTRYHERKEAGLCIRCGKPNTAGGTRCKKCKREAIKSGKKRRRKLKAEYRCVLCGGDIEYGSSGSATCLKCRDKMKAQRKKKNG